MARGRIFSAGFGVGADANVYGIFLGVFLWVVAVGSKAFGLAGLSWFQGVSFLSGVRRFEVGFLREKA